MRIHDNPPIAAPEIRGDDRLQARPEEYPNMARGMVLTDLD